MGEQPEPSTPYGPRIEVPPPSSDPRWRRQWLVQTLALPPILLLSWAAIALRAAFLPDAGSGGGDRIGGLLALLPSVLLWAALMALLAFLLRGRSVGARAGWSAFAGAAVTILPLLPWAQAPWMAAAVDRAVPRPRRIAFAIGGALAAAAGALAVALAMGGVRFLGSETVVDIPPLVRGVLSALVVLALAIAITASLLARRRGWAWLAIIGLLASGALLLATAPQSPQEPAPRSEYRIPTGPDGVDCETDPAPCGG